MIQLLFQDVTCTATHARPEGTFDWYLKVISNGNEEKREVISVNPNSATTKQEMDGLVTTIQVIPDISKCYFPADS